MKILDGGIGAQRIAALRIVTTASFNIPQMYYKLMAFV